MKKQIIGHCGREGRQARALVREALTSGRPKGLEDAIGHIQDCPACRGKMDCCSTENENTVYGGTVKDTVSDAMRAESRSSRLRFERGW